MNRFFGVFALLVFALMCAAGPALGSKVGVCVSILPQKFFVDQIGGELVDVSVMVMPGASPATYEPSARQMTGVARAMGYFSIGVPFEKTWLPRIRSANKDIVLVRTDAGIAKLEMDSGAHGHDDHGHDHGIPDPHVWLSPKLVRTVAANTCNGLVSIDPDNESVYRANLAVFLREIDAVDRDIRQVLKAVPEAKRTFMVFHPSWGYFAHEYGLRQVAIEVGGKSPSPRDLAETVAEGRELGISVVFVQPQFSSRTAKIIASEIGAGVAVLDPLAEDWSENLHRAAESFRQALR